MFVYPEPFVWWYIGEDKPNQYSRIIYPKFKEVVLGWRVSCVIHDLEIFYFLIIISLE